MRSRLRRLVDRSMGKLTGGRSSRQVRRTAYGSSGDLAPGLFVNPIAEGADPDVVKDGERFLWCQAEGNVGISIWTSARLTSLGTKHVVWRAAADGPCSKEVWAPELIRLDGRWHVYFAASDGRNRNHRTFVLVADTDDPLGSYTLEGPLFTGDQPGGDNLWSIDFTVLEHDERRFGLWSGWPDADTDRQDLYIAEMSSPTDVKGGRVRIAEAGVHDWERIYESPKSRGLLEGPRVLQRDGRTFVLYSCAASWLPTYKLGVLELTGDDPMSPSSWARWGRPVFASTDETYGVGHSSCVHFGQIGSADEEWWHVFHSKVDRRDGWRRALHVQPMEWRHDGTPMLGEPLPPGQALTMPRAYRAQLRHAGGSWDFGVDGLDDFDYYGHHQYVAVGPEGLDLGVVPDTPVNHFRSGEKVVLRGGDFSDVEIEATWTFVSSTRSAGVLFRTTGAAVGYDAQRSYFAAIVPKEDTLVIGKTDGSTWTRMATTKMPVRVDRPQTLRVSAVGTHLVVTAGGSTIELDDSDHARGSVGLRTVNTHARFRSLTVSPLPTSAS
ncbi:MAG TPA: glycoside hydrolase family 43 protein [Nocardioidaceae bacterium]